MNDGCFFIGGHVVKTDRQFLRHYFDFIYEDRIVLLVSRSSVFFYNVLRFDNPVTNIKSDNRLVLMILFNRDIIVLYISDNFENFNAHIHSTVNGQLKYQSELMNVSCCETFMEEVLSIYTKRKLYKC